jgi:hypothetical protein
VTTVWDPFGTLAQTLWIGGGQWAGKSTVGNLLARRHGLTCYHYDYPDGRGHWDRRVAGALARDEEPPRVDPETWFVRMTPEESAAHALGTFRERFDFVLDDLRALVSGRPIVAEGWGLRPELVAPVMVDPGRMVLLVPTEEFRLHQRENLDRAGTLSTRVSSPESAVRNRMDRDRLVAADAVASAERYGVRVIEVDGSRDPEAVADLVTDHFRRYLPQSVSGPSSAGAG